MHILIVEDEKNIRQELKILLENSLYQVTALEDFSDVAAVVLRTIPDLVLLDLSLPEESGFEICAKIRAASEVPVIFVTGKTDSMDELTGMLKGADDYITKPFSPPVFRKYAGIWTLFCISTRCSHAPCKLFFRCPSGRYQCGDASQ